MKHYIGTDIIEITRIRQTIQRWGERFLNRVYTRQEQKMYDRRAHSLAACFAGKEAVMNPDTFQLICAGFDGNYGADNPNKRFPHGAGYGPGDWDNVANFSFGKTLRDWAPK